LRKKKRSLFCGLWSNSHVEGEKGTPVKPYKEKG